MFVIELILSTDDTDLRDFFAAAWLNLHIALAILGLKPCDKAAMLDDNTVEFFIEEFT